MALPDKAVQIWPKSRGLGCVTSVPAADENRDAGFTQFRVDAHNIKAICVHNLGKDCSRFQHSTSLALRLAGLGPVCSYCIVLLMVIERDRPPPIQDATAVQTGGKRDEYKCV